MNRVETALTRKFGPLPAWAIALLGGGALFLWRHRGGGSSSAASASADPTHYVYQYETRQSIYQPPAPAPDPIGGDRDPPPAMCGPGSEWNGSSCVPIGGGGDRDCPPGQEMRCPPVGDGPCICVDVRFRGPPPPADGPGNTRGQFVRRGTTDRPEHVSPAPIFAPPTVEQSAKRSGADIGSGVRPVPVVNA